MSEQAAAYETGRFAGVMLLGILALVFLARGLQSAEKSARFANLALFAGLLAFFRPEILADGSTINPSILYVTGVLRIMAGIAGIIFAVIAFRSRGEDGGTGIVRPSLGLAFSALHCALGASSIALPALAPVDTAPWRHQLAGTSVSFQFPSSDWMLRPQTKIQNGTEFTRGGVYPMRLLLFAGDAATQEDFQAIFGKNSDLVGTGPGAGESTREFGGTSSNQRFAVMHTTVKDPASKQTYFFCMYCVWAADKKTVITFMFETPAKYVSATGNSLQVKWFKEQARKIIDSAL